MKLSTVKKMDNKNRLLVPLDYLRLLDIETNTTVHISVDTNEGTIIIRKLSGSEESLIEKMRRLCL